MVEAALPMRAAAGAPKLNLSGGAGDRLVELTVAVLGFAAGDPASTLTSALERWRPDAPSVAEARADLAAVRATLEDRLAGPTPRLNHLLDVLTETETARRAGGPVDTDPLDAFVPQGRAQGKARPRPRLSPDTRAAVATRLRRPVRGPGRGNRGPRGRRPRPAWPIGPAMAAVLMAVSAAFAAHPGLPQALLPNFSGPHAPRPPEIIHLPVPAGPGTGAGPVAAPSQVAGAPHPGAPARAGAGRPSAAPAGEIVMAAAVVPTGTAPSGSPSAPSPKATPTPAPAPSPTPAPHVAPLPSPKPAKHATKHATKPAKQATKPATTPATTPARHATSSTVRNLGAEAKGAKHGATASVGHTGRGAVAGAGG